MPITPNDYVTPPLQIRRGHISSVSDYQAASGELVFSTNTNQLFIGDGVTVGGILIAEQNQPLYTTSSVTFYNITATNLAAGSSTYIVYYNTASGQLSYDLNYSGGGGGGSSFDLSTVTNQSLFTTSSVTFSNITATNTLTTNNIQSADSIVRIKQLTGVVIEGSTAGLLYSKANNDFLMSADYPNSRGGRIALQYGENNGIFLGNHNQTQILTINTSNGVTVHSTLALNAANASITTGTITYVKSDNYLGNSNDNNLFFGNGTQQAILYARGQQNLQLSANAETGMGAKIFLETGETGSVKLGHFNNSNVMSVNTATGVTIGSIATFNSNIRATGLANSTASFVLYYNNSNNEITYGASTSGGGSAFDLSTVTNQALFTTSTVTFNALTISTTATISANGKIITTATTVATALEIFNNSSTTADHSSIRFFRQRGSLAPQVNNILAAVQVDGWQTTTGYGSNTATNRRFPGIDWRAAGTFSANNGPTQVRLQNRVSYGATNPFPYNITNSNSTDTTVVEQANFTINTSRIKTQQFALYDPVQGWDDTSSSLVSPTHNSVFGTQRFQASNLAAGSQFQVSMPTSYTTTTNELSANPTQYLAFRTRTNHVPYWAQYFGSLNTSTAGQINWFVPSGTAAVNVLGYSMVRGPQLKLNALRYERGNYTVVRGTASTSSTTALWNTSTKAGDVLGSIAFQGALESYSIGSGFDGDVDGIVLRAYAVNDWQGQNSSTTTDVTYSSNETALRIEHANTSTIGGVSANTYGLAQQYGVLVEFGKTTSTFNTVVNNKNNVIIKDSLLSTNKLTGIASTASQVVGSFDSTAYNAAKFLVKVVDGTTLHFVEISVITDGTDIWKVEYGTNTSDGALGTFSTNLNGTVVELLFAATATPTNMNIITAITALPKL